MANNVDGASPVDEAWGGRASTDNAVRGALKISLRSLALAGLAAFLSACGSANATRQSTGYFERQHGELEGALKKCSEQTGYDPAEQGALGQYDLGAGELQWRDCAYEALLMVVVPNTPYPALYMDLVANDKELTRGIEERYVTRDERQAKISGQLREIVDREEKAARLQSAQADMEERMRIDAISASMHALVRNAQRGAR